MPLAFFLSESRLSDDIYVLPSSYKVSKHYLSKPPCVLSINFVCQILFRRSDIKSTYLPT